MYEKLKEERVRKAKEEIAAKKELLKKENVAVQETREEDVKNIEKLRDIVDESDKLWYDNLKKNETAQKEAENMSACVETVVSDNVELKDEVNNFKSENMQALESDDPWVRRKNESK